MAHEPKILSSGTLVFFGAQIWESSGQPLFPQGLEMCSPKTYGLEGFRLYGEPNLGMFLDRIV
jgi:hypothetical protein